jgi:hypothetical protein
VRRDLSRFEPDTFRSLTACANLLWANRLHHVTEIMQRGRPHHSCLVKATVPTLAVRKFRHCSRVLRSHPLSCDRVGTFIFHSFFPPMVQTPLRGQGFLIIEASRSHSDIPHSMGLLWTGDEPDAETSSWQHTTVTRDRNSCPRQDSNPQFQQANGRNPPLRPRGHWDRHWCRIRVKIIRYKSTLDLIFEHPFLKIHSLVFVVMRTDELF